MPVSACRSSLGCRLGDGYDAFRALLSGQEESELMQPALRRGRRIMDDAGSSDSQSEDDQDASAEKPSERLRGIFHAASPLGRLLDASLVGSMIYLRWKDYGWQLGQDL